MEYLGDLGPSKIFRNFMRFFAILCNVMNLEDLRMEKLKNFWRYFWRYLKRGAVMAEGILTETESLRGFQIGSLHFVRLDPDKGTPESAVSKLYEAMGDASEQQKWFKICDYL